MENLFLSILLLISINLNAGECSKSKLSDDFDSPIAYMDDFDNNATDNDDYFDSEISLRMENLELYNNKLNEYLSKSDDIKIQLSAFNSFFGQNYKTNEIKKALKKAISTSSDRYTIYLADSLCHNNEIITNWCHQQKIHEIHREIDPENVFSYLFGLNEKEKDSNIQEILDEATDKSTYSDSFFFEYTLEQANQIELFNIENPNLFNAYSSMTTNNDDVDYIQEIKNTISAKQLVEKGIVPEDFLLLLNENTPIIGAIGRDMATTMPFRKIIQSCQIINNTDSCLQIGKLLMTDKTLMNKMIGSAILTEVTKLLTTDEEIIKERENLIDQISKEQMCYSLIDDVMYAMMGNKKLMTQYIVDAKKYGELRAHRNLAYTVYDIEIKNGFNPDFNPKDCE